MYTLRTLPSGQKIGIDIYGCFDGADMRAMCPHRGVDGISAELVAKIGIDSEQGESWCAKYDCVCTPSEAELCAREYAECEAAVCRQVPEAALVEFIDAKGEM